MYTDQGTIEAGGNINDLATLKNLKEVKDWTEKMYPQWLLGTAKRFSDDYPHLTCSWVEMCKTLKTKPAEIMLVSYLPHKDDPQRKILNTVCDIFSRCGFLLRREIEFKGCPVCSSLLPTQEAWQKLTVKPPFKWSHYCRLCQPTSCNLTDS